ncbi:hypothetical protein L596_029960 [Steinernema carpocapsae]|uniref:SSD domain-containing protein n=1 Tax=Steinernema carpocapsae TaxID=34508 RepID=A0A4U5LRB6_STECR|nr:hypothetical protein L596_029960 [Steinernema carpocapsae]
MVMLISPFLTAALAMGLNDAFLLSTTWMRLASFSTMKEHSLGERLAYVFERVGSTVVLRSITNALAFGMAVAFVVPEIKIFCTFIAVQMLSNIVFQIFLFSSVLVLTGENKYENYEKPGHKDHPGKEFRHKFEKNFLNKYCAFLTILGSLPGCYCSSLGYLAPAIHGVQYFNAQMDPAGFFLQIPGLCRCGYMSDTIWPDQLTVVYIIRNPPDFEDPIAYRNSSL